MATITVTTASDNDADGLTLREALAQANLDPTPDTVVFAPNLANAIIGLTRGELTIGSDVTVDGGDLQITIEANYQSRVLAIEGGEVTLKSMGITEGHTTGDDISASGAGINAARASSLTLVGMYVAGNSLAGDGTGEPVGGGGIYAGGDLVLQDSIITNNTVSGAGTLGAGIFAFRDVSLNRSTVGQNIATGDGVRGGGIYAVGNVTLDASGVNQNEAKGDHSYAGGISAGNVTLTNSTIAGNRVDANQPVDGIGIGGGIFTRPDGVVSLTNSTLTGNHATLDGGGISAGSVEAVNSIVVGNTAGFAGADIDGGLSRSNGHNLFGSVVPGTAPGDLENVSAESVFPFGGALADNGGPTRTVALLDNATNPAIGHGEVNGLTTDQRGDPRPGIPGSLPDIGAFEVEGTGSGAPMFTEGGETLDLRRVDLARYPGALGTQAGAGDDTVYLSNTQNRGKLFIAGQGEDTVFGGSRGDKITGSQGDDRIGGGGGDDLLYGGIGNDRLHGDGGADTLKGSAGADAFIFTKVGDSPAGAGRDLILDFTSRQGDLIDLAKIDANAGVAGNQGFVWKGDGPLTGVGQLHYRHVGGDTIVEGNVSGSAAPEIQIELHGHLALAAGDFLL